MIDLNRIIHYDPGQPSARSRTPARWREPLGKRVWARNFSQPGSTQDNAIELSNAPTSGDLRIPESVGTTLALGSPKMAPPLEPVVNDIIDLFDEADPSKPSDLQLQEPARKASLSDDYYLNIDGILSATWKNGVERVSCALPGQSEEPSHDIRHASELGGKSYDISNTEQTIERVILESATEPTKGNGYAYSQANLINAGLQSQHEPELVLEGQPESSRLSPLEPAATEEKEYISDHWTEGVGNADEPGERSLGKKPSTKRARSLSTSPEPAKRPRWRLHTRSCLESEAEDARDAYHEMPRRKKRITNRPFDSVQSATVPDGDWLIDAIVGERQGGKGREFMIEWKPTWVLAKDVNAKDCKQRWREQKRRLKACGIRR